MTFPGTLKLTQTTIQDHDGVDYDEFTISVVNDDHNVSSAIGARLFTLDTWHYELVRIRKNGGSK